MRFVFIVAIVVLMSITSFAQEEHATYQLRTPSLNEYLALLSDFRDQLKRPNDFMSNTLYSLEAELLERLPEGDYQTLRQLYDLMKAPVSYCMRPRSDTCPIIGFNEWIAPMVAAHLNTTGIALEGGQLLLFDDISVLVEAHDFDADGTSEYLLQVRLGSEPFSVPLSSTSNVEFESYLTAQVVNEPNRRYNVQSVPMQYYSNAYPMHFPQYQQIANQRWIDITGDDVPEWELTFSGGWFHSGGYITSTDRRYVLQWRDGRFEQILYVGSDYPGGRLINLDGDPALEIEFREGSGDNWSCFTYEMSYHNWNGIQFEQVATLSKISSSTSGCTLRRAEEAMWAGDYATAIPLYQDVIGAFEQRLKDIVAANGNIFTGDTDLSNYGGYAIVRRVIANAMLGNTEDAREQLEIAAAHYSGEAFATALLSADLTSPEAICRAAYDFFANGGGTYVVGAGEIIEDYSFEVSPVAGPPPVPERAGCDIGIFNEQPLIQPEQPRRPYILRPSLRPEYLRDIHSAVYYARAALQDGDYEQALIITDRAQAYFARFADTDNAQLHLAYLRALALLQLERDDEALNQFLALYETKPDSIWGRLAALHFVAR
jgi:tetratricopeptide (TPR) repeat protein